MYHHCCATYESASLRMFRLGRTDTIRSASNSSAAFVKAFDDHHKQVWFERSFLFFWQMLMVICFFPCKSTDAEVHVHCEESFPSCNLQFFTGFTFTWKLDFYMELKLWINCGFCWLFHRTRRRLISWWKQSMLIGHILIWWVLTVLCLCDTVARLLMCFTKLTHVHTFY